MLTSCLAIWAAASAACSAREQARSFAAEAAPLQPSAYAAQLRAGPGARRELTQATPVGDAAIRSVGGYVDTPLSQALANNQSGVEGAEARPFRFAADIRNRRNKDDYPDVDNTIEYLRRVLSALQSLLGHSIRCALRRRSPAVCFTDNMFGIMQRVVAQRSAADMHPILCAPAHGTAAYVLGCAQSVAHRACQRWPAPLQRSGAPRAVSTAGQSSRLACRVRRPSGALDVSDVLDLSGTRLSSFEANGAHALRSSPTRRST